MSAKVETIHNLLCDAFIRELSAADVNPEVYKEVIRFLKDNNVQSLPVPGSKVAKVASVTPQEIPFPRAVAAS